jgi:hypothetical protein
MEEIIQPVFNIILFCADCEELKERKSEIQRAICGLNDII